MKDAPLRAKGLHLEMSWAEHVQVLGGSPGSPGKQEVITGNGYKTLPAPLCEGCKCLGVLWRKSSQPLLFIPVAFGETCVPLEEVWRFLSGQRMVPTKEGLKVQLG